MCTENYSGGALAQERHGDGEHREERRAEDQDHGNHGDEHSQGRRAKKTEAAPKK